MTAEITEIAPLSVFVTGATTALGRAVTRQLRAAGHRVTGATSGYENAAIVRADGGIPAYPNLFRAGEMRSVMTAAKADVVLNLAPQAANHLPQARANWDARLMSEGVDALLEAAQQAEVKFVVHASYAFAGEHAEALDNFLETVRAGERKVLTGGVPGCVLRLGFVYGAESPELVSVRNTLLAGRTVDCGPADSHVWWLNVPDAARAVIAAMNARPAGVLLNVVEDKAVSPAAFMGYFAESQGMTPPGHAPRFAVWAQPSPTQAALMRLSPHISNVKAKELLGWSPRFPSYREAIDDALLSWRAATEVGSAAT
ncbi:MAG: NAD(P)-dependent oxidoreductase [Anaerolineae bacterium]|nr:NAD(P)-dependent oxidoreductase [Anaerolineae bacterium]